jgi:flagellar biogenesis protein FliO
MCNLSGMKTEQPIRLRWPGPRGLWIGAAVVALAAAGLAIRNAGSPGSGRGPSAPASRRVPAARAGLVQGQTPPPAEAEAFDHPAAAPEPTGKTQTPGKPESSGKQTDPSADKQQGPTRLAGRKSILNLSNGRDAKAMLWQMLASVAVLAVLLVLALLLVRRYGGRLKIAQGREMKLIETLHLAPRRSVHMIEVQGRRILVSSTRDSVGMLTELPDPPAEGENRAAGKRRFPTRQELETGLTETPDQTPEAAGVQR